jgi:hypothetical protein
VGIIDKNVHYIVGEPRGIIVGSDLDRGTVSPASSSIAESLVSWWELDEASGTRVDSHGPNDLADINTVTSAAGKTQTLAANFTAANHEQLYLAAPEWLHGANKDFTVWGWIYMDDNTNDPTFHNSGEDATSAGNNSYLVIYDSGVGMQFSCADGGGWHSVIDTVHGEIPQDTWAFFIGEYRRADQRVHSEINRSGGVTGSSNADNINGPTVPARFQMGDYWKATTVNTLDGRMQGCGFHTRLLTDAEKDWLYNNGAGRTYDEMAQGDVDADFGSVQLYITGDQSVDETPIIDYSFNGESHEMTLAGNVALSASPALHGGTTSIAFDGTGDYILVPYNNDFNWYVEDYTIEAWVYATSFTGWEGPSSRPAMIGRMQQTGTSNYWSFGPSDAGVLRFYYYNGAANDVVGTESLNTSAWNHVAMTNESGTIKLWVNGVADTTAAISGTPQSATHSLVIGAFDSNYITGSLGDIRITRGVARYTTAFTVADAHFPKAY